jgi:hypothetical protein
VWIAQNRGLTISLLGITIPSLEYLNIRLFLMRKYYSFFKIPEIY